LLTGRGLKYADLAILNALIQCCHELLLYAVRLEWMMEFMSIQVDRSHALSKTQILQRAKGRVVNASNQNQK